MRRLPASLLVLTPLALALLYAAAHALLAPRPDLGSVVPRMAVLTARFRGVEALDQHWPFDRAPDARVSESLAAARNVAGLPGVDRSGPFHFVLLPREARADPTLVILPVSDAEALRSRFEGRDAPADDPRGLQRHAQHLEVRGDFAALAWDREAVRHLGEGGITCEDRGEDFALAADVPALVAFALSSAGQRPWRPLVEALGAEPAKFTHKIDEKTGARSLDFPAGRVPLLAHGWRTARLWAWKPRREVQIELEPADEALLAALRQSVAEPASVSGAVPDGALAWLEVYGHAARTSLSRALYCSGVRGAKELLALPSGPGKRPFASTLRLWAVANQGEGHGWTVVVHAVDGELPSFAPMLPTPLPTDLPAGAAPFTVSDTRWDGPSPAGKVLVHRDPAGAWEALVLGADAERAVAGWDAMLKSARPLATLPQAPGYRTLARFGLAPQRVRDVLGLALTTGGLFSVLADGGIDGEISTDGRILRITLRAAAP